MYALRYRLYIWSHVKGMPFLQAMRWPTPDIFPHSDPIGDAKEEVSYINEGF